MHLQRQKKEKIKKVENESENIENCNQILSCSIKWDHQTIKTNDKHIKLKQSLIKRLWECVIEEFPFGNKLPSHWARWWWWDAISEQNRFDSTISDEIIFVSFLYNLQKQQENLIRIEFRQEVNEIKLFRHPTPHKSWIAFKHHNGFYVFIFFWFVLNGNCLGNCFNGMAVAIVWSVRRVD